MEFIRARCIILFPSLFVGIGGVVADIFRDHFFSGAILANGPFFHPDHASAHRSDGYHVVAHEDDRTAGIGHPVHAADTFPLEIGIAYGQHFVHDEDLRIEVCGHGETQAHLHTAAVALDGRIDVVLDAAEID